MYQAVRWIETVVGSHCCSFRDMGGMLWKHEGVVAAVIVRDEMCELILLSFLFSQERDSLACLVIPYSTSYNIWVHPAVPTFYQAIGRIKPFQRETCDCFKESIKSN